jgi:hypothetical protein
MSDRTPEEEDLLERVGEGEGEPLPQPEGGGSAWGDESYTPPSEAEDSERESE